MREFSEPPAHTQPRRLRPLAGDSTHVARHTHQVVPSLWSCLRTLHTFPSQGEATGFWPSYPHA